MPDYVTFPCLPAALGMTDEALYLLDWIGLGEGTEAAVGSLKNTLNSKKPTVLMEVKSENGTCNVWLTADDVVAADGSNRCTVSGVRNVLAE